MLPSTRMAPTCSHASTLIIPALYARSALCPWHALPTVKGYKGMHMFPENHSRDLTAAASWVACTHCVVCW